MSTAQIAFDLDSLILDLERELAPAWTGAPLNYHKQYATPAELDAAFERWKFENGNFGCIPYSHMWHRDEHIERFTPQPKTSHHHAAYFTADARCDNDRFGCKTHQHTPGEIPNDLMYQIICEPCSWHFIGGSENDVAEAWHDHALPGWRELPAVPLALSKNRDTKKGGQRLQDWVEEHYPQEWQQTGYPIVTTREAWGTRHVPGRSPWGGYDLSATQ